MDLSLLPHLSDDAVRDEAKARGLEVDGKSRDALIAAIRASEANAGPRLGGSAPPGPPKSDGAVGKAKALFGRVARLAKAAIDGRPPSQPPPPLRASQPAAPPEPINTLTMARVLLTQGHLERAATVLAALDSSDPEVVAARAEAHDGLANQRLESMARGFADRDAPFVEIARDGGVSGLVWHVDDSALARGRALLGEDGELTLRVVSVIARANHRVESVRSDHAIAPRGHQRLDSDAARVVVSVGLAANARFVSLAHAAS